MPYVSTLETRVKKVDTGDPMKLGCIGSVYVILTGFAIYWLYANPLASAIPPRTLREMFQIPYDFSDTAIRVAAMLVLWLALHTMVLMVAGLVVRTKDPFDAYHEAEAE